MWVAHWAPNQKYFDSINHFLKGGIGQYNVYYINKLWLAPNDFGERLANINEGYHHPCAGKAFHKVGR